MRKLYEVLLKKVKATRNARLEAYRRSNRLQSLSTYSISGISALTIASSLYIAIVHKDSLNDLVGLTATIASLFILIISLIDGSKEYSLKAFLYHKCSLDLDPICLRLEKCIEIERFIEKEFDEISKDYHTVLSNYSLNHTTDDYKIHTWRYRAEFHEKMFPITAKLFIFLTNVKTYAIYILIIGIMLISTIFLIMRMYSYSSHSQVEKTSHYIIYNLNTFIHTVTIYISCETVVNFCKFS